MPRPRRDEHEVLLDRIATALSTRDQLDPWTLAEIAPAAGLSPAGLIKRFGSRKGILEALSQGWIDSIPDGPLEPSTAERELRGWISGRFTQAGPHGVAQGLVNLLDDLVDDDLRNLLAEGWAKEICYLAALLEQLNFPGLRDPATGAALLFDALNGAMLRTATRPDPLAPTRILDYLMEAWS